jgi:hypothetical protein
MSGAAAGASVAPPLAYRWASSVSTKTDVRPADAADKNHLRRATSLRFISDTSFPLDRSHRTPGSADDDLRQTPAPPELEPLGPEST